MSFPIRAEVLDRIKGIKSDKVHGASWLACEALRVLELAARESRASRCEELMADLKRVSLMLTQTRPSIAPIVNAVSYAFYEVSMGARKAEGVEELRELVAEVSDKIAAQQRKALRKIAGLTFTLVKKGSTVLTHSYSSTVKSSLIKLAKKGIRVLVAEARPLLEGRRLARELADAGLEASLIVDASVSHHIKEADFALAGADSILLDGSVVNKVGTRSMALSASYEGVPLYILSDTWKFEVRRKMRLEEKDPSEVADPEGLPRVEIRNIYFDVTPPELVTGLVTELGVLRPAEVSRHAAKFREYLRQMKVWPGR